MSFAWNGIRAKVNRELEYGYLRAIQLTGLGAFNGRGPIRVVGTVRPKIGICGLLVHDVAIGVQCLPHGE